MSFTGKIFSTINKFVPKKKNNKIPKQAEKEVELILQSLRAKIFFGAIAIILTILLIFLLRDYFSPIFFSVLFSLLIYPIYKRIYRRTKSIRLSTILSTLFLFILVVVPFVLIVFGLASQLASVSKNIGSFTNSENYQVLLDNVNKSIQNLPIDISQQQVDDAINKLVQTIGSNAINAVSGLVSNVIAFGINLLIFSVLFIFLLPRMGKLKRLIMSLSPLGDDITHDYIDKISLLMKGTVLGSFVISLTASTIMGITFVLLGIPNALSLACVAFVLGFIPYLGTTIFTFGGAIIFILMGNYFNAAVLVLVQLIILNQLDLVFRPITLPKKVRIHPSLTIIAVTAGLGVFGIMGIFYGIIILVLSISTVEIYRQNYGNNIQ